MKVIITGADGQLGSNLKQVLSKENLDIVNLTKSQLDISDEVNVEEVISALQPDWIINAAAYTKVDDAESNQEIAFLVNAIGPQNLAKSSNRHGVKLIQISTDYVFDGNSSTPYSEYDKKNPKSIYGASKSVGEDNIMSEMASDYYIVRTSWLYSEYNSNFARFMTSKAIYETETVEVVNDQFGQPTYAGDLANRIREIIQEPPKFGIYHGTNGGRATWFEFAREIFTLVDQDPNRVEAISSSALKRKAQRPFNSTLSHSQWSKNNFQGMRDWREALSESIPKILASLKKE